MPTAPSTADQASNNTTNTSDPGPDSDASSYADQASGFANLAAVASPNYARLLANLPTTELQALHTATTTALTQSHERDLATALRLETAALAPAAVAVAIPVFETFDDEGFPFYDPAAASATLPTAPPKTSCCPTTPSEPLMHCPICTSLAPKPSFGWTW